MRDSILVPRPRSCGPREPRLGVAARVGAAVRARVHRLPSLGFVSDRTIGSAVLLAPVGGAVVLPLVLVPPVVVAATAVARARRARRAHEWALTSGLADVLDQLSLAVGAGLSLPAALDAVAEWAPVVYRPVLSETLRWIVDGASLAEAIAHFGSVVPESGRRSIAVLNAAVRDGSPVAPSLTRAADEARRARRRAVETRVRRLPVLLLLPLVTCVLPAFVLLTLVPLVLGSLDGLQLPGS